jgi:hypothetical protein
LKLAHIASQRMSILQGVPSGKRLEFGMAYPG